MISLSAIITYGLLMFSIIVLWLPGRMLGLNGNLGLWVVPFIFSLTFGLSAGFVQPIAIPSIALLGCACYLFSKELSGKRLVQALAGLIILLLSIGFMAHRVPGFFRQKVIAEVVLSPGAMAYSQHWNFDKALVGLFILAFCHPLLTTGRAWITMLRTAIPIATVVGSVVIVLAVIAGYARFDIKLPAQFCVWAWTNLLFTCTAEEAFFRGFVQRHLQQSLRSRFSYGDIVGLALAALLFGLAHYAGGWEYVGLATIAGLGYGWVYQRTNAIESSILTHFSLNTAHFLFFTYPALEQPIGNAAVVQ